MPFLLNFRLLSIGAAVVSIIVIAGWIAWLRSENAELRVMRDALAFELSQVERVLGDRTKSLAALADSEARLEKAAARSQAAREMALTAPEIEDAPMAPVLAAALHALREGADDE